MLFGKEKKRIYLDYASATPVRTEVLKAMQPFWNEEFGNASAVHKEGVQARHAVETAREELARVLHVRPNGVVFTGSGTESNNLAIFGAIEARREQGVAFENMEVVSTRLEHPSVLEALKRVEQWGVRVVYAPVDETGVILTEPFEKSINAKTILVTFAYANSEIGTVQPVGRLARIVRSREKELRTTIYVHTDAAQAPLWLPCELDRLSVDMLSLDAGKSYGPKGVGVLAFRHGVSLRSHLLGGPQEGGLRPGTENTALIIGAVKALTLAQSDHEQRSEKAAVLRDGFISALEQIDGVLLNGSRTERIANNVNISICGIDSEFAVVSLDEKGIACSTKSACGSAHSEGSSVVLAITGDKGRSSSTVRFTLGEATTQAELAYAATQVAEHVWKMHAFSQSFELI